MTRPTLSLVPSEAPSPKAPRLRKAKAPPSGEALRAFQTATFSLWSASARAQACASGGRLTEAARDLAIKALDDSINAARQAKRALR